VSTTVLRIVEERSVDAVGLLLEDRAFPHRCHDFFSFGLSQPFYHVLDGVDISSIRENQSELLVGRLKDAEGAVHLAIDDLNVLHPVAFVATT
jgi:hypothetical protein